MALMIKTFILGPIENSVYLLSDPNSKEAVLIDPASPSAEVMKHISGNGLELTQIWITHAHFDHIGGVQWFLDQMGGIAKAFMHPDAAALWGQGGGARNFGFDFDPGPTPEMIISDGDTLSVGSFQFTVLETPGHSRGHVTYYCPAASAAFCGDLIFYHGVGRTDLAFSHEPDLYTSIQKKIMTMPNHTTLYPGHGKMTTVGEEKTHNPFL